MHWFGLNWVDILINVAALAIIPLFFAAYGGHLAAQAISDKKRSRNVKSYFWLLFAFGVLVTFWQQFRIAQADLARDTRETWGVALAWKVLFSPPPVPPQPPKSIPRPDLNMIVVNPAAPGLVLFPTHANAKNVAATPLLWDIDREDKITDSLLINQTAKYDWIRTDQHGGPTPLLHPSDVQNVIRPGHRILGYITVACLDCERVRLYWVYFVYGNGGWYTEVPNGEALDPKKIGESIPSIREVGPEKYLAFVPQSSRIPIKAMN